MGSRLRSKLTYANVTASLALFIALGGTGYAATQLPTNSVGSKQIRSGAVGASELRNNVITSRDIRNGTVSARDMSNSARKALTGPTGPAGATGPAGPTGSVADYRALVGAGGGDYYNRSRITTNGNGDYRVYFNGVSFPPADVTNCAFSATLAAVPIGPGGSPQLVEAGRITVGFARDAIGPAAIVRTYGVDGAPKELPFHIIAAC